MSAVVGLAFDRVRVPFRRPFATAAGAWSARECWIVRLADADGRSGLGEAVAERDADAGAIERLLAGAAAALAAGDGMPTTGALEAAAGPGRAVRAALDAARLDLDGPASTRDAGVNATIGAGTAREVATAARRAVEAGYRTLKLKIGADAAVPAVAAVREAVGPGVRLRLDLNASWDLETAVDRLAAVAPFGIEYAEQPLAADALAAAAALRRRVSVPIAADEAVWSPAAARSVLDAEAADVLVVKPGRVGGPAAVAEIAAMAAGRGVPVVVSTLFETGVGIAAALACATALPDVAGWAASDRDHGLATLDLLEDDLLVEPLVVAGGRLRAPGGPDAGGLGIRLDVAAVGRYRVATR